MVSFGFLIFVSVVAGLVGAMSGMSGGVILVPVLTSFGVDIKQAIAVSILSMIAVSNGAAFTYVRRHLPNLRATAFLEAFAVVGALFGASFTIAARTRSLFFLCGLLLLASGIVLLKRPKPGWKPAATEENFSQPLDLPCTVMVQGLQGSYYDDAEQRTIPYEVKRFSLACPLMLAAGAVAGLLGIGGSAVTVLIHDQTMQLPPKVSVTMSNLIIGVMALAGASVYLEAGLIDLSLAVPVLLAVPLGAWIGSKWLVQLNNRIIRIIVFSVIALLGVQMIAHGIRGSG